MDTIENDPEYRAAIVDLWYEALVEWTEYIYSILVLYKG